MKSCWVKPEVRKMTDPFPILIAEDDPVSRKLLEKSLTNGGYRVVCAENGRQAMDILEKTFFPLVITDWMMPQMNGLELCRAIRAQQFEGYVFIVLVTAKDNHDDIIKGLEAGADDYITKPYSSTELIARLKGARRILELERSLREANERIRILSITDPLTGIYNRGYMTERLSQEIARARRYMHPLCLIMSDIDHFKIINDLHGHQAGDRVLRHFTRRLSNSIRKGIDWLARYGGEEFLIVLPETPLEGARHVAERLRILVSESPVTLNGKPVTITASFGVSEFDPSGRSGILSDEALVETLIGEADRHLYEAKRGGRNRVNWAEEFNEEDSRS